MIKKCKYTIAIFSFLAVSAISSRAPINLFWPTDRPLQPYNWKFRGWQLSVGYEGALKTFGFQPDEDELCETIGERRVNVLQLWQNAQNVVGMLYGVDPSTETGCSLQLFNEGNNGLLGRFRPYGELDIPLNLLLSARYYILPTLTFGLHLPVVSMELNNIRFEPCSQNQSFEDVFSSDMLQRVERLSGISVAPWKRTGVGDLIAQLVWTGNFPQPKPLLRDVRLQTRLGLIAPTGKEINENLLLALPFGNDGSWALQAAFGLDLTWVWAMRFGVDFELLYLFGDTKYRRIKTDFNQTDLFLPCKAPAFKRYGLNQQYNLFVEYWPQWRGFFFRLDYQYLTQNESRLYVKSDKYDPRIVNSAESLQEWSTHSFIFQLNYDFFHEFGERGFVPGASFFYKKGFNGKRAILADTLGFRFTLDF